MLDCKSERQSHKMFNICLLVNFMSMVWATFGVTLLYLFDCPTHLLGGIFEVCTKESTGAIVHSLPPTWMDPLPPSAYTMLLMTLQFFVATQYASTCCLNYILPFLLFGTFNSAHQLK